MALLSQRGLLLSKGCSHLRGLCLRVDGGGADGVSGRFGIQEGGDFAIRLADVMAQPIFQKLQQPDGERNFSGVEFLLKVDHFLGQGIMVRFVL